MAVPTSMTVSQMIDSFLIEYDRIVAQVSQSYTDSEIISFLNRSQEITVGELCANRRYDLLGSLYAKVTIGSPTAASTIGVPNGYYILNTNAGFTRGVVQFVDVSIAATRTNLPAGSEIVLCEWIDRNMAKDFYKTLSNTQILFRQPKVYTEGIILMVLVDGFTSAPSNFYVQYVRYPLTLVSSGPVADVSTTTSELRADIHKDIVTLAVKLAKEATDRLQQNKQE